MSETRWLFDGTADAAWAIDADQQIVCWNKAAEEMLGYSVEEATGQYCWCLMEGRTPQGQMFCRANCPIMSSAQQGEACSHYDLMVKHRDGQDLLVNVSSIPVPIEYQYWDQATLVLLFRQLDEQPSRPDKLSIYLMGPTKVRRPDGTIIDGPLWRRAKVRGLLAFLALQRGQPVDRQVLIEALWPDLDHDAALRNLNTTVYNLRRSLEPDLERGVDSRYIYHAGGLYWLSGGQIHWLDVDAFESGIRRARLEEVNARAIDMYEKALELHRGDFLADLIDTGVWNRGKRDQLHMEYLVALEELGGLCEKEQQIEAAEVIYQRVLTHDPYRESARRKLFGLSRQESARVDKLTQCQRLVNALRTELETMLEQEVLASIPDSDSEERGKNDE